MLLVTLAAFVALGAGQTLTAYGPFAPPRTCSNKWKHVCAHAEATTIASNVVQAHSAAGSNPFPAISQQINSGTFNRSTFYPWLIRQNDSTLLASGAGLANLYPININELRNAHVEFQKAFGPGSLWVRFLWHQIWRIGFVRTLDSIHAVVIFFDDKDVPMLNFPCNGTMQSPPSLSTCSVYEATRLQARLFYDILLAGSNLAQVETGITSGAYTSADKVASAILLRPNVVADSTSSFRVANPSNFNMPSGVSFGTVFNVATNWDTLVAPSLPCGANNCTVIAPFQARQEFNSSYCAQSVSITPCNLGIAQSIGDSNIATFNDPRVPAGGNLFTAVYNISTTQGGQDTRMDLSQSANGDTTLTTAMLSTLINTTLGLGMTETAFRAHIAASNGWLQTNAAAYYVKGRLVIPIAKQFGTPNSGCTDLLANPYNVQCVMAILGKAAVELLTVVDVKTFEMQVKQKAFDSSMNQNAIRTSLMDETGTIVAASDLNQNGAFLLFALTPMEALLKELAGSIWTTGAWYRFRSNGPTVGHAVAVTKGTKKFVLYAEYSDTHSASPTGGPTVPPTHNPSRQPSIVPTNQPSNRPTSGPTTPYPTVADVTTNPDSATSLTMVVVYAIVGLVSLVLF